MERRETYQYSILLKDKYLAPGVEKWRFLQIGTDIEDILFLMGLTSQDSVYMTPFEIDPDSGEDEALISCIEPEVSYFIRRKSLSQIFETHERSTDT